MNMKPTLYLIFCFLCVITISCKKDKEEETIFREEQLNVMVEGAVTISGQTQAFLSESLAKAIEEGFDATTPPIAISKLETGSKELKSTNDYAKWSGPDRDGWYTRSFSGLYNYYEKLRKRDTIEYMRVMEYHGGDGSYLNQITTKYIKYTKHNKVLFKGYSHWELESSGYNEISASQWKIVFEDWNPDSSAGIYDWYWGVSENSGGNTVRMHRYEHLEAIETQPAGWLLCKINWYDENETDTWEYEFETPFAPVEMPEIPEIE